MNDRIHAYLDGELPLEALTEAEMAEVLAFEQELGMVTASLGAVTVPNFSAEVMSSLAAVSAPKRPWVGTVRRALEGLWAARTFTVTWRPAYALGGLAATVAFVALWPSAAVRPASVQSGPAMAVVQGQRPALYVQFRLEAPGAESVALAGSFTGWTPGYELVEGAEGVWTALVPLAPGVHDYTFIVNGEDWVIDPAAPRVDDDFGGSNNRLFLPQPDQA